MEERGVLKSHQNDSCNISYCFHRHSLAIALFSLVIFGPNGKVVTSGISMVKGTFLIFILKNSVTIIKWRLKGVAQTSIHINIELNMVLANTTLHKNVLIYYCYPVLGLWHQAHGVAEVWAPIIKLNVTFNWLGPFQVSGGLNGAY